MTSPSASSQYPLLAFIVACSEKQEAWKIWKAWGWDYHRAQYIMCSHLTEAFSSENGRIYYIINWAPFVGRMHTTMTCSTVVCMYSPNTTVPVAADTTMMRRFGGPSGCFLLGCRCTLRLYTSSTDWTQTTHTNISHSLGRHPVQY